MCVLEKEKALWFASESPIICHHADMVGKSKSGSSPGLLLAFQRGKFFDGRYRPSEAWPGLCVVDIVVLR